jgi:hypothetical protein
MDLSGFQVYRKERGFMVDAAKKGAVEPHFVVNVPFSEDYKNRCAKCRKGHSGGLEVFRALYLEGLSMVEKGWSQLNDGSFLLLCSDLEKRLEREFVGHEDGFLEKEFKEHCKWVRLAIAYKVSMKVARVVKSQTKLEQIKTIAAKLVGGHTTANMEVAYDSWVIKNKMFKTQDSSIEETAIKEALAKRGISVADTPSEGDISHEGEVPSEGDILPDEKGKKVVLFVADTESKRKSRHTVDKAHRRSPYGLMTIDQISDRRKLGAQLLDTIAWWFGQDGMLGWVDSDTSPEAVKIKKIYQAIQD